MLFTGEAGTITYLLAILLVSLILICRLVRSGTFQRLREIGFGILLLLVARLLHASPIAVRHPEVFLSEQLFALAGLHLLLISLVAGMESNRLMHKTGRILAVGFLSGAILSWILFAKLSGGLTVGAAIPLMASIATFTPVGFLAAAVWEGKKNRKKGRMLVIVAVSFLVVATCIAGLSHLELVGNDPFWKQLFSMTDIAGFLFLLASAVLEPGVSSVSFGTEPQWSATVRASKSTREQPPIFKRVATIDGGITSDRRVQDIFQEIVEGVLEAVGADIVLLRIAKSGEELYDVKAQASRESVPSTLNPSFSISRATYDSLCRSDKALGGGFILKRDDLKETKEHVVPTYINWKGKKIFIAPVVEHGILRGFLTVGFFDEQPSLCATTVLELYKNKVLHVIQRERSRERVLDKERSLALCREELDSVNQLKSNFLSIVSHELRTPLTSVKAYTETLLDNLVNINHETVQDFLRVMNQENDRLIKLVDNILSFSQMESGHLKVEKTSCNLNRLIEDITEGLQKKILAGNVNADLRLPKKSVIIDADRELIRQLLQNLMSNAVKFTPGNGKVTVTLEEEASSARIVVQDTGRGIPEDQLERIFERFHQVDTSNTREHGGSGLGLAICKNIVDWHDGKIWVENVKEAGAKFVVLLPMKDIVVRHAAAAGYIGSRRFEREKYMTLLVEMIAEFLQSRKASIMLLDKGQQILRIIAAKGLDSEFVQNTRLEVGDRIAGRVAQTGEVLHVFDIEAETDYGRANNSSFYGTHSFISVPLREGIEIVGVLNVSDHVEGREFTEADRELLEALGGIIVGMLKKLEAYERVSSNFEKLKDSMRSILDMRETWGSKNLSNLTLLALAVGKRLNLDEKSSMALRLGMNLYDLGLMKVPRSIRAKKEELDEEEREKLRAHPNIGYSLISLMGLEERIMRMVRCHHENHDGSGYPDGLIGDEIPIEARIVNVVDSFRALISEGPYRRCYSLDEARNEIIKSAGTKFDPKVVGAFVKSLRDLGAREYKCELILDAVERELEGKRRERRIEGDKRQLETVKEGTP